MNLGKVQPLLPTLHHFVYIIHQIAEKSIVFLKFNNLIFWLIYAKNRCFSYLLVKSGNKKARFAKNGLFYGEILLFSSVLKVFVEAGG